MPVTAPADRRFLRVQPRPARARRGRYRLAFVAARTAAVITIGVWAGVQVVDAANARGLFEIRTVMVGGAAWLTGDEVREMVADMRGQNVLSADLEAWRSRLMSSPWVLSAEVRRRVPSTMEVRIVERTPIGIARRGEALFLVDGEGVLVDRYGPRYAQLDLPIISGLKVGPETVSAAGIGLAASVLRELAPSPELLDRVSEIDVSNPRDAVLTLEGDDARLRLGDSGFAARLAAYLDLAPTLREHVDGIHYVDLRFGRQVYVGLSGPPAPRTAR
ncbi:MAG: cell division protein FtsQ/DivIB [Vicinamibacterales bacterium]